MIVKVYTGIPPELTAGSVSDHLNKGSIIKKCPICDPQ